MILLHRPMVFLNFAPTYHIERQTLTDVRHLISFLAITEAHSKSIYILCPVPRATGINLTQSSHKRYLVPSAALDTVTLRKYNHDLVSSSHTSEASINEHKLQFRDGKSIHIYRVTFEHVKAMLWDLFSVTTPGYAFGNRVRQARG